MGATPLFVLWVRLQLKLPKPLDFPKEECYSIGNEMVIVVPIFTSL